MVNKKTSKKEIINKYHSFWFNNKNLPESILTKEMMPCQDLEKENPKKKI